MDSRDIDAERLDGEVLKAFLADHVARYGRLPSASVMPLLEYSRTASIAGPEPKRCCSPLDAFLDEYRYWLAGERALSPDTVRGYTRLAHRFLAERVSAEDTLGVERLAGAEVTGSAFAISRSCCSSHDWTGGRSRSPGSSSTTCIGGSERSRSTGKVTSARVYRCPAMSARRSSPTYGYAAATTVTACS